jgi:hypothetical protein
MKAQSCELVDFVTKGAKGNIECAGGMCTITIVKLQGFKNELGFNFGERLANG